MTRVDPDLVAVNDLAELLEWRAVDAPQVEPAALAVPREPSLRDLPRRDQSLARVWAKTVDRADQRGRHSLRFRPRRGMIAAASAAVVLAIALTGSWVAGIGRGSHSAEPLAPPTMSVGESLPVDRAWAEIIGGARGAVEAGIPDDAVVYVRSEGSAWNYPGSGDWRWEPEHHEMWLDPLGFRPLRIIRNGQTMLNEGEPDRHPMAVAQRRQRANLHYPTVEWLAALPTDPAALEALLLRESKQESWSNRYGMWEALSDLFRRADLALRPDVRVAIYDVMAAEDGLTATVVYVDGRRLYAIGRVERDHGQQIIFDPETGRAVGRRWVALSDVEPNPADGVMSWSLWRQAVVDVVGRSR